MQNFAFGFNGEPQEEQPFVTDDLCLGIKEGSGDGKVPGSPNASLAETIPGGPPTGLAALPGRGPEGIPIIPGFPIPGINPGD